MNPGIPPETFKTARLLLRRPRPADAAEIFQRWTQDPDVTRYLVWERWKHHPNLSPDPHWLPNDRFLPPVIVEQPITLVAGYLAAF